MTDRDRRTERDNVEPVDDELLLAQVKAVLTPMPEVDRRHIAQILAATTGRTRSPQQRFVTRLGDLCDWWRFNTPPVARATTMAAAALTIGFVARGYVTRDDGALVSATATPPVAVANDAGTNRVRPTTAMQAVDAPADTRELRVATQFVLDTRDIAGATTVSIVGDFNDWNQTTTPLVIEHGAWTTTVPLAPGRHVYAFVVNGERWIVDPRAPQAPDSDFGRPSSVIIVRAP
jgi:hypothetical protein